MSHHMYVALQDDDKIAVFTMDAETGQLTPQAETPTPGGPTLLAISPDRQTLYAGHRTQPEIASFRIHPDTGGLTKIGTVTPESAPAFLATDRTGKYLLSSYYQGKHVAVHPIGDDGAVGSPPIEWLETAAGAHAMQTDPSNQFAFVPHIASLNDNVLEPPKGIDGPNMILQFKFDEHTGHLTPNAPFKVEPAERLGPRHFCFHPTHHIVYFSDEQGSSVTGYHLDTTAGTLSAFQTITTLPAGCTDRNTSNSG